MGRYTEKRRKEPKKKYPETKTQLKVVDVYNATKSLFPQITIDVILCAVYEKTDISYFFNLKHNYPDNFYKDFVKPHQNNLKFLNMPPCPIETPKNWYQNFVDQGGLVMTDGNTLPTLKELWQRNKDWKP